MQPTFLLGSIRAPAPQGGENLAAAVLERARAIVDFADRHPRLAFESGIEPVAFEMGIVIRDRALERLADGRFTRLSGVPAGDLAVLDRASRLQSETSRRLAAYEAALEEASSPSLGRVLETALSIASGVAVLASAIA
jgi:hypothetical protein